MRKYIDFRSRISGLHMQRRISFHLPIAAKAWCLLERLASCRQPPTGFACAACMNRPDQCSGRNGWSRRGSPLTEAQIAVDPIGFATYKMAGTHDPDTVQEATDELAGQYAAAKAWLNVVVDYLPAHREDVEACCAGSILSTDRGFRAQNAGGGRSRGARSTLEFKFDPALVDAPPA